eukprot:6193977-Pleurochrysis_carterae.AAC.1
MRVKYFGCTCAKSATYYSSFRTSEIWVINGSATRPVPQMNRPNSLLSLDTPSRGFVRCCVRWACRSRRS